MITISNCENCENFTKLGDYCKKGEICSNYGRCEDWKIRKQKNGYTKYETYMSKENIQQNDNEKVYEVKVETKDDLIEIGKQIQQIQKSNLILAMRIQELEFRVKELQKGEKVEDKWIIHRTLRKKNKEIYIMHFNEISFEKYHQFGFDYNRKSAQQFTEQEAIRIRDMLNIKRVGKRYLWVISEV